ncbi:hypothetical protein L2E82_17726 [Cichorium intybus]|uniref:Uncharacterized protein n=1 Tax=Cichorium intybus TaxID=13427 RepID=A0ACB9F8G0_CICIN|nr:hypothetical protein L2E82_17726 [Cichorium intybus]
MKIVTSSVVVHQIYEESAAVVLDWIGEREREREEERSWKVKGTAVFPFQRLILTGSGLTPSSLPNIYQFVFHYLVLTY